MQIVKPDIRVYKNELRAKYKNIRKNLGTVNKSTLDDRIFNRIISLNSYNKCETLLTFVSTEIEVDTQRLIEYSLKIGKKVAVPKCVSGTREMEFYLINSLEDLETATFSVLEPKTEKCKKLANFENSICIVPGLAYDLSGFRLGYGKGYYDRFLSNYSGENIGICYCSCTLNKLISGKFDKSVELLVTEKYARRTK